MKHCAYCKAETNYGLSTFMVELNSCIVVIRNVPSQICPQCGEVYYSTDIMEQLYKLAETVTAVSTEVAIVNYKPAA